MLGFTVGAAGGFVDKGPLLFSDITKKKASEELIWKQANFDALTGLPNRRMFHEHLRLEMKKTLLGSCILIQVYECHVN